MGPCRRRGVRHEGPYEATGARGAADSKRRPTHTPLVHNECQHDGAWGARRCGFKARTHARDMSQLWARDAADSTQMPRARNGLTTRTHPQFNRTKKRVTITRRGRAALRFQHERPWIRIGFKNEGRPRAVFSFSPEPLSQPRCTAQRPIGWAEGEAVSGAADTTERKGEWAG